MYQEFFGLRQAPFDLVTEAPLLVETASQRASLDAIADLVRRRVGVITLEGWVGAGKTEVLHAFDRRADPDRVRVVPIMRPDFDQPALFSILAEALVGPFAQPPRLQELEGLLKARAGAGQAMVVLVDDAQALTDEALRALGAIADLATTDENAPVSLVLAVRPPFVDLFSRPAAASLDRRASARVRLAPFTPAEARALIDERLRRAGAEDPRSILSSEALDAIVVEGGGIPRRLLILGDRVLRAGFSRRRVPVDYGTAETTMRGEVKATPMPPRTRPPVSVEESGLAAAASSLVRRVGRVAVPACLLIVALGLAYWLWAEPEETPASVTEAQAPPMPAPSAPPTQAEPQPAPPAASATAQATTVPAAGSTPAAAIATPSPPQAAAAPAPVVAPAPAPAAAAPAPAAAPPAPAPAPPRQEAAVPAPAPPAPMAVDALFIPARRGDTLRSLYRDAYRVPHQRPSFDRMLEANPGLSSDQRLAAGQLVALPGPFPEQ